MKNTFKLFIACCGLAVSINSNIEAMDEHLDPDANKNGASQYAISIYSNYTELCYAIKQQLITLNNLGGTNDTKIREINACVTKALNCLDCSLKELKQYESDIYDTFYRYKKTILNSDLDEMFWLGPDFEQYYDICKNDHLCKLLMQCYFCLSTMLHAFDTLHNRDYFVEDYNKIKQLILTLKDFLSL